MTFLTELPYFIDDLDRSKKAQLNWVKESEFDGYATVSEMFDNDMVTKFYNFLSTGLSLRACEFELDKIKSNTESIGKKELENAHLELLKELEYNCNYLEKNLKYRALPIQTLVKIQLESGLIVANRR